MPNSAPMPSPATQADFDAEAKATLRQIEASLAAQRSQLVWVVLTPTAPVGRVLEVGSRWNTLVALTGGCLAWWAIDEYVLTGVIQTHEPLFFWGVMGILALSTVLTRMYLLSEKMTAYSQRRTHSAQCVHIDKLRQTVSVFDAGVRHPRTCSFYPRKISGAKLPAFALPESERETYRALRTQVQEEITHLCGVPFAAEKIARRAAKI